MQSFFDKEKTVKTKNVMNNNKEHKEQERQKKEQDKQRQQQRNNKRNYDWLYDRFKFQYNSKVSTY